MDEPEAAPEEGEDEPEGEVIRPARRLTKLREIEEEDEEADKDKDQDMNE